MHGSEIVEVRTVTMFLFVQAENSSLPIAGGHRKRNKAMKKDAIAGAMITRIGATIAFEIPSRPSAQFFKSSNPEVTSDAENRKFSGNE